MYVYVLLCCAGDYYSRWSEFLSEVTPLLRDGRIRHEETVINGFEKLPEALAGLFKGINIGKVRERMEGRGQRCCGSATADDDRRPDDRYRRLTLSRCRFPCCNRMLMRQMIVKVQE